LSELRLSFGNVAETYHRVRPHYSRALLERAQDVLGLDGSARVLDLAAGTGRLTRELESRFAEVIAVEPDERMRAVHGMALAGSAEAIPLDDESVDAVFVGEAFHWFDPTAAIDELARVLRPRGGLAILWTHWWETEPPLPESALELLREPYQRFAARRAARALLDDELPRRDLPGGARGALRGGAAVARRAVQAAAQA
jgi:ubiquinone/menaquinone biosynthesis C-methylase UbiE